MMVRPTHSKQGNIARCNLGTKLKETAEEDNTCASHNVQCTGDSLLPEGVGKVERENGQDGAMARVPNTDRTAWPK
jgi:hypothetical protein